MDQSYHDLLAAGVEKRFRDLEMAIMDDIIRRIRKAGTITDSPTGRSSASSSWATAPRTLRT